MAKSCILQTLTIESLGENTMKLFKTLLALIILAAIGGGIYLGTADINMPQKTVVIEKTAE